MDHEEIANLVFAVEDGQASPSEAEQARAHLLTCEECRQSLEAWRKFQATFSAEIRTTDENFFVGAVMKRINSVEKIIEEINWHAFVRWAIPMLGLAFATFCLTLRTPYFEPNVSTDSLLLSQNTAENPLLGFILENE